MDFKWSEYSFGELCTITRGASPRPINAFLSKTGMPWIKIADATSSDSRFLETTNECIKLEGVKSSVRVFPGDLILSNSATPGLPKFVKLEACIHDGWMLLRNFNGLDKSFAYWLLLNERKNLIAQGNGSVFTNLKTDILKLHRVKIPDLATQAKIAQILDSISAKVDLNRRINQTLEAMAQAIFKSWFVDFDPVKAKITAIEQGQDPLRAAMRAISGKTDAELDQMPREHHDQLAATAELFPDAMEESELGEIPKGWSVASIYEIANVIYGAPFASKLFNTEGRGLPIVRIRDLRNEEPGVWTDEVHPKGYLLTAGDIVVGMDGEFRAYLWGGEPAWLNQRVCVFKPLSPHSSAFVRCAIAAPLAHIEATEVATTVIHLGKGDIDKFTAVVPDEAVALAFAAITNPLYAEIVSNKAQMRQLSRLRDTLLPKLLSGELSVADVEIPA